MFYFSAFDHEDGPLTPEESEQYHLAKRKMLGNIKFIGKWLYNRETVSPGKEENAGQHSVHR